MIHLWSSLVWQCYQGLSERALRLRSHSEWTAHVHEPVRLLLCLNRSLAHALAQQAILLTAPTLHDRLLLPVAVDRSRPGNTRHHVWRDESNVLGHSCASRVDWVVTRRQCTSVEIVVDAQAAGSSGGSARKARQSHHASHACMAAMHVWTSGIDLLIVLQGAGACTMELRQVTMGLRDATVFFPFWFPFGWIEI